MGWKISLVIIENNNKFSNDELLKFGLIDDGDGNAWHPTYYVSDFGKEVLSKKRQRSLKLKDILENDK